MFDQTRKRLGFSLLGVIILSIAALQTISAQSSTWYVATSGTNSTSCGSSATPCATVNYVLSNRAAAGHTIRLQPGTYTNQGKITVTLDGITITAADPNNRPQLWNSSISIPNNSNNVTVSDLRIRKSTSGGYDGWDGIIEVYEYPTIINNNELWDGNQGIIIQTSQQVTVTNNHIHNLGALNTDADAVCVLIVNRQNDPIPSGFTNAIRIAGNDLHNCEGDGVHENSWSEASVQFNYLVIENNKIYNNQEQGIDTKGTDDLRIFNNDIYGNGQGGLSNNSVYGSTARWEVYNNRIHDHGGYGIFNQGGGQAWKIWNNVIYNNLRSSPYNTCAVTMPGDAASVFYGNTVVSNYDTSGGRITCGISDKGSGANITNNIFYNNGIGSDDRGNIEQISGEDGGTPSNNYVYPASCGNGQCKTGTNAVTACASSGNCPAFVNMASADFRLASTSPAINAGATLASAFLLDSLGNARVGAWDLGAFEYGGTTTVPAPAAPSNVRIVR